MPKTGTFWSWRFMADGEIFIISTTLYQRFAREIPNELNEYNVFGDNNLRHFGHQISQPLRTYSRKQVHKTIEKTHSYRFVSSLDQYSQ